MTREVYTFIYKDKEVYKGYFKPYMGATLDNVSDVQIFAQGITMGLRAKGIKNPEIKVLDGEGKIVMTQR